jgi:cytidylate kinase
VALEGWENAHAGDGASDLASLCEEASLDEEATLALVQAYEEARGGRDARLIPRLCARRLLSRLSGAARVLRGLYGLADLVDVADQAVWCELRHTQELARERLLRALNGLSDFTGPARPLAPREVEAMGALMAVEELRLRGQAPVVAMEGGPYVGKTPLAQDLARRLRVPWVGVAAVLRVAARALGPGTPVTPDAVAAALGRVAWRVEGGRVVTGGGGQVVGLPPRAPGDVGVPDGVAEAPVVRRALAGVLAGVAGAGAGAVAEGQDLTGMLPDGARRVLLWASREVRAARWQAHQESLGNVGQEPPWAPQEGPDVPPVPLPGQLVVDGSHLTVAQQARLVLRSLLPPSHEESGMTGRPVLFS